MEKSVVIHAETIMQKFNEALIEFVEAEGDLPETISIVAKGTENPLGQITIKKTVFEHPKKGEQRNGY